ncbi:hypothetical protein [Salibacterium aidingense]|uniref:hypothetical protein n=1 Tax=Salibacterium aidingense TaxID=384933 RepID=UPI00040B145A|nr:hypothetical protein [Salibacterium aidingense]
MKKYFIAPLLFLISLNDPISIHSTQTNEWDKYVPYKPYSEWENDNPYSFDHTVLDTLARAIRDRSDMEDVANSFNGNSDYVLDETNNFNVTEVVGNSSVSLPKQFYIRDAADNSGAYTEYESSADTAHVYTSKYPKAEMIEPSTQNYKVGESFQPQFRAQGYALENNNPTASGFSWDDISRYTFELTHSYYENGVRQEEIIATNETISPDTMYVHRAWDDPVQVPSIELREGTNIFEVEVTDAVNRTTTSTPLMIDTTPDRPQEISCGSTPSSQTEISGTYPCPPVTLGGPSTCYYYETLSIDMDGPNPGVVKAGQGTDIEATTHYMNENPAHSGNSYAPSVVTTTGTITENWPDQYEETVDMLTETTNPETYWGSGRTVSWQLPYAMIDKNGTWTMTDSESEAVNFVNMDDFHYGGLQRWYTGFDVPDGETITFDTRAEGGYNDMEVCATGNVEVSGSPYDDFVIHAVDPSNPFPEETGLNWQGHENLITRLENWFHSGDWEYASRKQEAEDKAPTLFDRVKDIFGFAWGG